MSADIIARLRITLDDVKPAVLRRIEVPLAIRLDRLHLAIQAAMGSTNSHLYDPRSAPAMSDGASPIPTGVVMNLLDAQGPSRRRS